MSRNIFRTLGLAAALVVVPAATHITIAAQTPAPTPAQKSTDDTLEDRIEYRLETDAIVKKYDIKVKVTNAEAVLTGHVATDAQKAEAGKVAKIDGVTRVQNNVTVDPGADKTLADRTKAGLSKTGEAINDAWIVTKVKWFFVGEDLLKDSNINVDANNKVVTLKGTVKSAAGRTRAVELARGTDGVARVVDELTIK